MIVRSKICAEALTQTTLLERCSRIVYCGVAFAIARLAGLGSVRLLRARALCEYVISAVPLVSISVEGVGHNSPKVLLD